MKKIIILISIFLLFGCGKITQQETKKEEYKVPYNLNIVKSYIQINDQGESSPLVVDGKLYYFVSGRDKVFRFYDFETRQLYSEFSYGLDLASAININGIIYVLGTKDSKELYLVTTTDLINFSTPRLIYTEPEKLFNSSMCFDGSKYVISYEVDRRGMCPFSIRFLTSIDLINWQEIDQTFGADRYNACPTIRYSGGYYYMIYLYDYMSDSWYISKIARSKDLINWETSTKNILAPDDRESNNTSDVDICEYDGKTYLLYAIGNQAGIMGVTYAIYDGSMQDLFNEHF